MSHDTQPHSPHQPIAFLWGPGGIEAWTCPHTIEVRRDQQSVTFALDGERATIAWWSGYNVQSVQTVTRVSARRIYRELIDSGYAITREQRGSASKEE